MAPQPFFKPEDAERVSNLLNQGLSFRRAAIELGCDKNTVATFVRKYLPEWYEARSGNHTDPSPRPPMRILTIDIETRPNLAYIWDIWQRHPIPYTMVTDEKEMISFAAKWADGATVEFRSTFHDGRAEMVTRAHALLNEADAVITYNGARFDLPHLNLEFLRNGMTPPAPYKSVDLLQTVRRKFRFTSNKLGHVGEKLGIGAKVEHEGFALWEKCMAGDADAWSRMREYNIQDVVLTEQLYRELLPWIEGHPSYASMGADLRCPNCGSEDLHARGTYHTKTGTYNQFQCDACGKWVRDTHRHERTGITETAMS